MVQIRTRVYTTHSGQPLSALIAKLENPTPLLEDVGQALLQQIRANLSDHVGRSGTLLSGFDRLDLYQKRGQKGMVWAVGIGNPEVLTDWNQKAPAGTIAAFLRWVFDENKRLKGKNQGSRTRKHERLAAKSEAKRLARAQHTAARLAEQTAKRAERRKLASEFVKLSHEISRARRISEKQIEKLESLREIFRHLHVGYARLGRVSAYLARRSYRAHKLGDLRDLSEIFSDLFATGRQSGRLGYFDTAPKHFQDFVVGKLGTQKFPGFVVGGKFIKEPKLPKNTKPEVK